MLMELIHYLRRKILRHLIEPLNLEIRRDIEVESVREKL
jgi:hypothetical protein